ncbi:MAG: hypothetical protein FWE04_08550, partial [Oscillospiraceae bacterium]|nr:hypothetical protein [Oscillospiraceae bacterium]
RPCRWLWILAKNARILRPCTFRLPLANIHASEVSNEGFPKNASRFLTSLIGGNLPQGLVLDRLKNKNLILKKKKLGESLGR